MNASDDWISRDAMLDYRWQQADARAMQRSPEDIAARDHRLARCIVRCLVARLRIPSNPQEAAM